MRRVGWLLLAALLIAPTAIGGSAAKPDIVDDENDVSDPAADLRAAWIDPRAEGLRFTVQVRDIDGVPRDHLYFVQFRVAGDFVFAAVGFGGDTKLRTHMGSYNGPDWNRGGFETAANERLVGATFQDGPNGRLSATIPWESYPGLNPGATIVDLAAGTTIYHRQTFGQWSGGSWEGGYDTGSSNQVIVLQRSSALVGVDAAPGWLIGTTLAGGGLGFVGALVVARRAPPAAPASTTPPPAPQPSAATEPRRVRLSPDDTRRP